MADEEDSEEKGPAKACSGLRQELLTCLKESDCVKVVGTVIAAMQHKSTS